MSDGSQADSEADIVDLTSEDDLPEEVEDDGTPSAIELVMMVDGHGEAVNHTVEGPDSIDSMDSGESDVSDDEIEDNDPIDSDPDDDDEIEDNDPVDNDLNDSDSDDSASDSDSSEEDDGFVDPEPDDDNWSDVVTEPDTDTDDDDESEDEMAAYIRKNARATFAQFLAEEDIHIPEWNGNCAETCQAGWNGVARGFHLYRNKFLQKRNQLAACRTRSNTKSRHLRAFKTAVMEFYRAMRANIDLNHALRTENATLRQLAPQVGLANFPEPPIYLPLNDMWAALPREVRENLPPRYRQRLRWLRETPRPVVRRRKTERVSIHHDFIS